ncbi:unnamed protein product [Heligmosomoides polygyrus]|uniref:Uncharacterized protein n=1 Tax=Heligmosomoides polygyrus TaxID=6339 RepID=A0A183GL68_HELPZ|nr:unnamed protein product [Heligmosomoides polygyrus]
MSVEFTEDMLLGDEIETEGHAQNNQLENHVESEMQSLSLEKTMTPFEQERVAGQPLPGTTVLDELPRALEDIPDDVLLAYAKRRLEAKEPKRMPAGHRATPDGKDTSALSLFYSCAGSGFDTKLNYNFHCSVRGMSFKDVVPHAEQGIANLRFNNVFQLARLIAIFEHEKRPDRRRFLMNDLNHNLVTFESVQKAYAFYNCAHVFQALMQHDGSHIQLLHDGGIGIDIIQLNDLMNSGLRFATRYSWNDVKMDDSERPVLILLPSGFRKILESYQASEDVDLLVYGNIAEIASLVKNRSARAIIFVGPTSDRKIERALWLKVCSPTASLVRNGTKLRTCKSKEKRPN